MTHVFAGATMSLDGYIAGPGESGFDLLFQWYGNGDVEVPSANPDVSFRLTPQSAEYFAGYIRSCGALVVGRHLFDITSGWGGRHPMDVHTFVLTHSVPEGWENHENFTFVHDGIESAIEQAKQHAGPDKIVGVNGGTIARQALEAGLLDEVFVDLVPVLLGSGTPLFSGLQKVPVKLEGPISIIEGKDVTHLRYQVVYP